MTIPFLSYFKRSKAGHPVPVPHTVVVGRRPAAEKPPGERLSKTVLPNATRTVPQADPFLAAAGSVPAGRRSLGEPIPAPVESKGERCITLNLTDVLEFLPDTAVRARGTFEANRSITLRAAEVEKGMASLNPTASLASIYEQAPE